MKAVIGRGLVLSFLFTAIAAVYIYFLLGLPLEESWFAFYELTICGCSSWLVDFKHYSPACLGYRHMDGFFRKFKRESD